MAQAEAGADQAQPPAVNSSDAPPTLGSDVYQLLAGGGDGVVTGASLAPGAGQQQQATQLQLSRLNAQDTDKLSETD